MGPYAETYNTDRAHTLDHTLPTEDISVYKALQGHGHEAKDR
jgi:hypothetical protein